jgi:hypothetical protein
MSKGCCWTGTSKDNTICSVEQTRPKTAQAAVEQTSPKTAQAAAGQTCPGATWAAVVNDSTDSNRKTSPGRKVCCTLYTVHSTDTFRAAQAARIEMDGRNLT